MIRFIVLASSMVFAMSTWAGPNQIEIISLVPGESTQDQVEKASSVPLSGNAAIYVIGGHGLVCVTKYIDGVLSELTCLTQKKEAVRDRMKTTEPYIVASNTEVHDVLLKGFTKKFGAPSTFENLSLRNRLGTEFSSNTAIWIDKKGNKLTIISMLGNIDEGVLILQSAQQIRENEARSKKEEQQRKF